MNLKEYFPEEEIRNAEKIIQEFHGRMLLDNLINNPTAIVLSLYMLSNKEKTSLISKKKVKELFISFGRKGEEFDKTIYEITGKRKGKAKLIDVDGDNFGINFEGLKKIKNILKGIKDE